MPDTNHTTGTDTNTTKLGDETLGISLALKDSSTWLFQTRHARDGASEAMETIEEGAEITLKHSNTVLAKVSDAFVCDKYDCAMYNIDPSAVNVGAVANIPGAFQLADTDCYHFGKILSARGYVTSTAGESSLVHCRVWCNSSLENLIQGVKHLVTCGCAQNGEVGQVGHAKGLLSILFITQEILADQWQACGALSSMLIRMC
eukprot:TRINITY_DN67209_c5_g3_i2.p1 TRINITY_DN67209_c5_g3~~TRINITY_DN67209_c5_g3_i2.p1  ORF type:complete len:222 (+),score=13.86 TRINITY_DN67209_c5_g3_i2:58-666(+)